MSLHVFEPVAPADEPVDAEEEALAQAARPRSGQIAKLAASSAMLLLGRRLVIMVLSAVCTAIVARRIGVGGFGVLASAQGVSALLAGIADFGFSTILAREMAVAPELRGRIMGASLLAGSGGGVLAALAMVAVALVSGPTSDRGIVLFILAPSLLLTGVGTYRQGFMVLYRTRRLGVIDVATNLVQSALTIVVALAGGGIFGVAIVISAGVIVNSLLVALVGRRLIGASRPPTRQLQQFLRSALPLGLASFLSSMYFTIDLVLLVWLVDKSQLGDYAAAVKFLNLLVMIPGFVMAAVFPGLSSLREDRRARSELAARIWHWLIAFGLPGCVGAAVFARVIIHLSFGSGYGPAVGMFQVLSAAAAIALASNVLGVTLNALSIARWQVVQNTIAMVFNILANVLLAPHFGAIASAWITLATELIVCSGSTIAIRHRIDFAPSLALTWRPVVACGALAAVGLVLGGTPVIAIPASILAFVVVLGALRGWPVEFTIAPPRRPLHLWSW